MGFFREREYKNQEAKEPFPSGNIVSRKGLSREQRLRKRPQYLNCYRWGERYFSRNFILYVRPRPADEQGFRLGVTVTKKVGKAVRRSRLKRLVKEVVRLNQFRLHGDADIVVVVKKGVDADKMNYWRVERELMATLARAFHVEEY